MGWVTKGETTPQGRLGGWDEGGETHAPSDDEILRMVGDPMYLESLLSQSGQRIIRQRKGRTSRLESTLIGYLMLVAWC